MKKDSKLIINKIKSHLGFKTDTELADFLGTTQSNIATWKKRDSINYDIIIAKCPEIDANWLLTGGGPMLKTERQSQFEKEEPVQAPINYSNTIPLYDLEATAGVSEVFSNNSQSVPIDHITIPNLPKCDGALYIRGDSMYPLLKSGDIVAFKTIHNVYNIIWGEMYLIYICHDGDEYFFCKFIKKSEREGFAQFISHNQHHQTIEFPLESIKSLAMVKASIRFNTLL